MTEREQILELLHAAFPSQPVPEQFFWKADQHDDGYEFRRDLRQWLEGRAWTDIRMHDWTMVGDVSRTRELLEPATFLYYLPSLLIGVTEDPSYFDWALAAIIPAGRDRRPKSQWWIELLATIAPEQRAAIRAFVAHVRQDFMRFDEGPFVISGDEVLTAEAEAFWDAQIRG